MIFKELILENVGLFAGENRFDLTPGPAGSSGDRNSIILFGGKNGTGKTTILDSVRLCLYGKRALGGRVSRADYRDYLRRLIHRSPAREENPTSASVSILLSHSHAGQETNYLIQREWTITDSDRLEDQLFVYENGEPLDQLEPEHWEDFVRDLVPFGVSQLFFFDGEKIQSLAEEEGTHEQLAQSIKMLLGLHLTDRLVSDLDIYLGRIEGDSDGEELREQIEALRARREKIGEDKAKANQELAQRRAEADHLRGKIERKEDELASEGASFAETRSDLRDKKTRLETEIETLRDGIRELATGLLPFALAPSLLEQLGKQLDDEALHARWSAATEVFDQRLSDLVDELKPSDLLEVDETPVDIDEESFRTRLRDWLDSATSPPEEVKGVDVRHHLSEKERQQIRAWISEAKSSVPEKLREASEELEKRVRERRRVAQLIKKAPSEEQLKPIMEEISDLNQRLGGLEEQITQMEENVDELARKEERLERELRRTRGKLEGLEEAATRERLVTRVQRLLDDYREKVTERKIQELRFQFVDCFNRLARKEEMLRQVQIDPDDFSIVLQDDEGNSIPKSQLSAGEKQLYAVAMLWALGLTTGRPLPVIVDTPLARLDSDHRENLIQNYFPNASHQVIILSTDTEIDTKFFKMLEDDLAQAYHLSFDPTEGCTEVEEGYFWTDQEELADAV